MILIILTMSNNWMNIKLGLEPIQEKDPMWKKNGWCLI